MSSPEIIFFTYDISVYGRKVDDYLALRGLSYKRCIQPPILPRPALQALGVHYRRIPIIAIGKDIYCDSRAIISTLEKQYPSNRLGASDPFAQGVEYLLENFINDGGPFWRAAQMIPPSLISPEFAKDRSEMTNRPFEAKGREKDRPEAMAHVRMYFDLVEHKLLADGRKFLSGSDQPKLADVHVAWNLDWATGLASLKQKGETGDLFTQERYPRVWAWLDRYKKFVSSIHEKDGRAGTISVEDAVQKISGSDYVEKEGDVDPVDPLKLQKGQLVEMWPTDSGMNHHDKGKLVSIGEKEVCVESEIPGRKGYLRIHCKFYYRSPIPVHFLGSRLGILRRPRNSLSNQTVIRDSLKSITENMLMLIKDPRTNIRIVPVSESGSTKI